MKCSFLTMWFNSLSENQSWSSLWNDYIRCKCGGIKKISEECSACGQKELTSHNYSTTFTDPNGNEHEVNQSIMMGGEGRYEDWVYLDMLEREWNRPIINSENSFLNSDQSSPSPRAIIVLIFWTYFETRIERIYRETLKKLPKTVVKDLLERYSSIGYRLDKLYKITYECSYWSDLHDLGFGKVSNMLNRIQTKRNRFVHGHPEAIDDELVEELVENLKLEHQSYISVFNKRMHEQSLEEK